MANPVVVEEARVGCKDFAEGRGRCEKAREKTREGDGCPGVGADRSGRERRGRRCEGFHELLEALPLLYGVSVHKLLKYVQKLVVPDFSHKGAFRKMAVPRIIINTLELLVQRVEHLPHRIFCRPPAHPRVQRRAALERVPVALPRVRRAARNVVRLDDSHRHPVLCQQRTRAEATQPRANDDDVGGVAFRGGRRPRGGRGGCDARGCGGARRGRGAAGEKGGRVSERS
mmetsp:Transcript_17720/g.45007  ORF Transcript_17720/g.45007 Transcript_17720/m.45007 type:complete len:229 (+) Transcript_17720:1071-1757(+)